MDSCISLDLDEINDIKCFKHDFKNHMYVLKMYLELGMVDKGLDYINRMVDETSDIDPKFYTGNTEVDIVLSQKLKKIQNINTDIDFMYTLPSGLKFDPFDVMIILGNLLDNAYEALINTEDRSILLDINLVDDIIYININNTHSNKIKMNEDEIATSKTDKGNHGIGLGSVKRCVYKNHGEIEITHNKDDFNVYLKIPLSNENIERKSN